MARPRKFSTVQIPPRIKGFNPVGYYSRQLDPVIMHIEEYEVIRLLDYENLSQEDAARVMKVSRPTLTRIYERVRKKIASALIESRQIKIEGGRAVFNNNWFQCNSCLSNFNTARNQEHTCECPLCQSRSFVQIEGVSP